MLSRFRRKTGNGAPTTGFPFKYTGRHLDPKTGLHYYRASYYWSGGGRFLQTALTEWAYACVYLTSDNRKSDLQPFIHRHNWHRPHGGIKAQTPIGRLKKTGNNLLRLHS